MKRFFPLLIIVLVLALGVGLFFLGQGPGKSLAIAQVLPPRPLAYLHIQDGQAKWEGIIRTEFWRTLAGVDYVGVFKDTGAPAPLLAQVRKIQESLSQPELAVFLKTFLGQECALTLYEIPDDDGTTPSIVRAATNIYVVTRLKSGLKVEDLLTSLLAQANKEVTIDQRTYGKDTIRMIQVAGSPFPIAYTRIEDLLVIGIGDAAAKRCLDTYHGQQPALVDEARYQETLASALPDADLLTYLDFQIFATKLSQQFLKWASKDLQSLAQAQQQISEGLKRVQGFQVMSYSARLDEITQVKMNISYDYDALDQEIQPLYRSRPRENRTLAMVPRDVLGYQWASGVDFPYLWQQSKEQMQREAQADPAGPSVEEVLTRFEQSLGLSLEGEVLPVLGQEVGGFLSGVDMAGLFPVPQLTLFLQVTDPARAEQILSGLVARQPVLAMQEETYQGVLIHFLQIPLLGSLEPAYALVGNYLLVATSRASIQQAVDARRESEPSLAVNDRFRSLGPGLTDPSNGVLFVNPEQVVQALSSMLDWGSQIMDMQMAKQEAFQAGQERRLAEVRKQLAGDQDRVGELETAIDALLQERDGLAGQSEELLRVDQEIATKEKFVATLSAALGPDQEEARQLTEIQYNEAYSLPEDGKKRLAALNENIQKRQEKIAGLEEELKMLRDQQRALAAVDADRVALDKQLDEKLAQKQAVQTDIESAMAQQSQLQAFIDQSARGVTLSKDQRQRLKQDLVRPVLKAVAYIKALGFRSRMQDTVIESDTWLEVR